MGKGLSPLQKDILVALEKWPKAILSNEELHWQVTSTMQMASTGAIIDALNRQRTAANYAATSKALDRLIRRTLVAVCRARCRLQGNGYRYALVVKA
jgi:hypothetical protein